MFQELCYNLFQLSVSMKQEKKNLESWIIKMDLEQPSGPSLENLLSLWIFIEYLWFIQFSKLTGVGSYYSSESFYLY